VYRVYPEKYAYSSAPRKGETLVSVLILEKKYESRMRKKEGKI
jgi:hypothetical protein